MKVTISYIETLDNDEHITRYKVFRGVKTCQPLFTGAHVLCGVALDATNVVFECPNKQFKTFVVEK